MQTKTDNPIEEIEIKPVALHLICSCIHCKYNTNYANHLIVNMCTISDDPTHAPRIVSMFVDSRLYSVCSSMIVRPEAVKPPSGGNVGKQ